MILKFVKKTYSIETSDQVLVKLKENSSLGFRETGTPGSFLIQNKTISPFVIEGTIVKTKLNLIGGITRRNAIVIAVFTVLYTLMSIKNGQIGLFDIVMIGFIVAYLFKNFSKTKKTVEQEFEGYLSRADSEEE